MLLLAVPPIWSYGYYTLLRLVVCGVAIYALVSMPIRLPAFIIPLLFIALLFNPIVPAHLSKVVWIPIAIAIAMFYFALGTRWRTMEASARVGAETSDE
jgi:hypothetical protein